MCDDEWWYNIQTDNDQRLYWYLLALICGSIPTEWFYHLFRLGLQFEWLSIIHTYHMDSSNCKFDNNLNAIAIVLSLSIFSSNLILAWERSQYIELPWWYHFHWDGMGWLIHSHASSPPTSGLPRLSILQLFLYSLFRMFKNCFAYVDGQIS